MPEIDLERKMEGALAVRLKQHRMLAKIRMRHNAEDSPKVNLDLILVAKRGEGNPPFSGIYNMEVTASISLKHRRNVDTLTRFLTLCAAMEEVFSVSTYALAAQLSQCIPDFHCYEIAVISKDDAPEDVKHKCVWSLSAIAMPQSYANAVKLNT